MNNWTLAGVEPDGTIDGGVTLTLLHDMGDRKEIHELALIGPQLHALRHALSHCGIHGRCPICDPR